MAQNGKARVSLIQIKSTNQGLTWLAEWLNARYSIASCVVIDGRNGVDVLCEKIAKTWKYKGAVIKPNAGNVIAAVSALTEAINEQSVTWYFQQEALMIAQLLL